MRRTKIVATLGPASEDPGVLEEMIVAGADMIRLGLAHGDRRSHLERIERVRAAAKRARKPVGVLVDLPGPKVRAAPFEPGGLFLVEGSTLLLRAGSASSGPTAIEVEYESLCDDLREGDVVTLGDGLISLRAEHRVGDAWSSQVVAGGRVQGRPGVHLPADRVRLPTPTADDLELVELLRPAEPDVIAVSFVRGPADLEPVREAIGSSGSLLLAKIETRSASNRVESLLEVADAVMVARGDLGIDCATEDVPHLQKRIIRTCVAWGVPVITATQMLESMVHSSAPTRAEASDVANAVLDGTDAVMLSGETAIGRDPVLAVSTMARLCVRAEEHADYIAWGGRLGRLQRMNGVPKSLAVTAAVTHAAWQVAVEVGASAVICCTRSGVTARAVARFRTPCPILAFSPVPSVVRGLTMSFGITPMALDWHGSTDDMVWHAVEAAVRERKVAPGDDVVVIAGAPTRELLPGSGTDVLRVVRVR